MKTNVLSNAAREMVLPLSLENLDAIKSGQYWYEDNTFSSQLIVGKRLKAIVVFVRYSVVYGDIFTELNCIEKDKSSFLAKCRSAYQEDIFLPTLYEHEAIYEQIKHVNASLDNVCGAPKWEGSYFTSTDYAWHQVWIKRYPDGAASASYRDGRYKIRPLIAYQIV